MTHNKRFHEQSNDTGYKVIDVEGRNFRVLMGTSPKEIEEWRTERRQKFPTMRNVMAKQMHQTKFIDSGGLPPKIDFGKMHGVTGKRKLGEAWKQPVGSSKNGSTISSTATVSVDHTKGVYNTLVSECGTGDMSGVSVLSLLAGYGSEEEEIEIDTGIASDLAKESSIRRIEEGFAGNFGGSHRPPLPPLPPPPPTPPPRKWTGQRKPCRFFSRGKCRSGADCKFSHDTCSIKSKGEGTDVKIETDAADAVAEQPSRQENGQSKLTPNKPKNKLSDNKGSSRDIPKPLDGGHRGTLLRKLLEKDIQTEENFLLQCFRFIVNNNFLQEIPGHAHS